MIGSSLSYKAKRALLGSILMLLAAFAQTGLPMGSPARADGVGPVWQQICSFAGIDWRATPRSGVTDEVGFAVPPCPVCGATPLISLPPLDNQILDRLAPATERVHWTRRSASHLPAPTETRRAHPRAPPTA